MLLNISHSHTQNAYKKFKLNPDTIMNKLYQDNYCLLIYKTHNGRIPTIATFIETSQVQEHYTNLYIKNKNYIRTLKVVKEAVATNMYKYAIKIA